MYVINRKSWHYRLASWVNPDIFTETNLCPYIRAVTIGLVIAIVLSAALLLFTTINILGIIDAYNGVWFDGDNLSIGAMANCLTGLLAAILLFQEIVGRLETLYWRRKYAQRFNDCNDATQPGFLTVWWQSFRNKMCMEIKVE